MKMNSNQIDIFSTEFFAEDPFGDHNQHEAFSYDNFQKMQLELYTVEEQISHSTSYLSETTSVESSHINSLSMSGEDGNLAVDSTNGKEEVSKTEPDHLPYAKNVDNGKVDDCVTDSTGKSTSYESTEFTYHNGQSIRSSDQPSVAVVQTQRQLRECGNPSCAIQRQTIRQQEEQIWFLRRKLQEYADLCERHNIGQDLLAEQDTVELPTIYSGAGTGKTNYEDKTYSDLMGPWDIPFHVELECKDSPNSDEYSGITFAQHPSKNKETTHRIRNCYTDDDDALPLIRPIRRRSSPIRPPRTASRLEIKSDERKSEIFRLQLPSLENDDDHRQKKEQDSDWQHRVRKMTVVIERKYGRQKALYSGMIDPRSGCPHGAGTLQFVKSGDVYIGEIAYGEMHGHGTYCHRKTNKLFRGTFVRNTFVGKPPPSSHTRRLI